MELSERKIKAMLASRQFAELLSAGYSASELLSAGYSASELLSAGYSASALRSAGYSASALRSAGYSASELRRLEEMLAETPMVEKPYSRMLSQIRAGERIHKQSTFGPDADPGTNICNTPMCTAGALVNLAGAAGYALKERYGWIMAGALIHEKAHPGWPCQSFDSIPQDHAMAYIEEMAEREEAESMLAL